MKADYRTTEHGTNEYESVYCVNCGCELNEETGVLACPDWYENTRYVHYCRDCQQKQFEDFADSTSPAFAYFLCSAAYNLPFVPEAIPANGNEVDELTWKMYLDNLDTTEYRVKDDGEYSGFVDGMTDLAVLFNGKINSTTKFAAGVTMESTAERMPGTKAQRRKWGVLSNYTTEDYKELDRLYAIKAGGLLENGIDEETAHNLRESCKLELDYAKAIGRKEYDNAKKLNDMRSKFMADNLMRKRDEAPVAPIKLDTLTDALEKEGLIKSGELVSYDKVLEWITKDQAHYPMSHDILDYIILAIINCIRRNQGQPETDELPYEFQITPIFGEFEQELSKFEENVLKELGLPPMKYEQRQKPSGKKKKGG